MFKALLMSRDRSPQIAAMAAAMAGA